MYAGSVPGVVIVVRNLSATAGSGADPLNGMLSNLIPAAFAAVALSSSFAPRSSGTRRLMIDAKPIFFSSGTASAVVAPPQATVVSSLTKLVAPATAGFVTCWANAGAATMSAIASERHGRMGGSSKPVIVTDIEVQDSKVQGSRFKVQGSRFKGSGSLAGTENREP